MMVEALRTDKIKCFGDFCKKHRDEVDESSLYDGDVPKI
ncbi:MAG: hypothetical protein K0R09_2002 [Clostridiales bacterium]|jgi:hypothetical protein|nr:hypothetical protein [Clostridiales bacterium]